MDERDVQLLAALAATPLASYQSLGRHIGVGGGAVKARLDRLQAEGLYGGTLLVPVPEAFGREAWILPVTKGDPAAAHPDAIGVLREEADHALVLLYLRPGEPLPPGASSFQLPTRPREGSLPLSVLDWRVIDASLDEPRATARDLAKSAGLAEATVRRRRAALLADGILHVRPILRPSRAKGLLLYTLRAKIRDAAALRALRDALPDATLLYHNAGHAGLLASSPDRAHMRETEERANALDGVSRVEVDAQDTDGVASTEKLRALVRDEIARWAAARRA